MILDLKTVQYYLSCYGTDVSRWPEPDAGDIALAIYAKELGPELTQTAQLDAALTGATVNPPSDLLSRRIMAALPAQDGAAANDLSLSKRRFNWRAIAASLVAIGAVGFTALSFQTPSDTTTEDAQVWREAALDMGVDDVFDWVYSEDS